MTPKEKAVEIYEKYDSLFTAPWKKHISTKQCALIAVDEILSAIGFSINDEYWQEVKQEIEKL
jgi:hypothetical protein